jgi:hypothetical protein
MRLELAGSLVHPDPVVLTFVPDSVGPHKDLNTDQYIDLGYTHFDVICIGGGGGRGGGIDTENSGTLVRNYGGEGGGGGFHRIQGLLSALPSLCPIIVGEAGNNGVDHISNPASTTDGEDGGHSSFNDPACRASGGKGGKHVVSNSLTVSTDADGGEGGLGNRIVAGGGAAGGLAGTPTPSGPGTPGTPGEDGTYNTVVYNIGDGGGGGAGGVGKYGTPTTCNAATSGGRGSYNPGDTSVYGPGTDPSDDPITDSGSLDIVPGEAGGAKASPLNKLPLVYGSSGEHGIVIVRLTAE